ncbi:MAG TPA: glycosyltransferase family 1 protein [Candidatus Acidoferrum sp.]|nr:glycosyltransferase family 1 protein [Candidatus Acidoferrum sp.]
MRVGIDTHAAEGDPSGNGTYIRGLTRALARLDDDVAYVFYALDPGHEFYAQFRGHPRVVVRRLWPRHALARIPLALAVASRRDRLDALHVQYVGPPRHQGALVVTIHDLAFLRIPASFSRLQSIRLRWQVRANARRAAAVITDSEHSKRDIRDAYGLAESRIAAIPLAADAPLAPAPDATARETVRRKFGITHRYVLSVGRLNARKNLLGLLRAFERVRPGLAEPAQLVLAGPRDFRADALDRAITASPCANDVLRVGAVSREDLPGLLSGAAVFAYPSLFEGFGLPPLEAMACGVPVICSNTTSLPEVVGDAALTFDPLRTDEIGAALRHVLTDGAVAADLIARGRARAARFSWRTTAELTLQAYRRAIRSAHSRA